MIKVVVLTGAGISAESGLKTFRDSDGLWENYHVEEVATPFAFQKNPELVLRFYNERRKQIIEAKPNAAHLALAVLEKKTSSSGEKIEVHIITQNIDDLHERAGSRNVIHLHGEILKSRSSLTDRLVYDCTNDISIGDKAGDGSQLRPHIVWFHEAVPMIDRAHQIVSEADVVMIGGTSLLVYPAAGVVLYAPHAIPKYIIDPNIPETSGINNLIAFEEKATTGIQKAIDHLLKTM